MPERERQSNIFWTLEALMEHVGSAGYTLRCEREGKPHATDATYHLKAIEEYGQELWRKLAPLLPDEYRASGNAEDSPA
jgi:hypothetical protein